MSKQTRVAGSKFGGDWTRQKLLVIEEYLKSYSTVLKNSYVKKIYIDAFAGSGKTVIENTIDEPVDEPTMFDIFPQLNSVVTTIPTKEEQLEGSALLSLKYDFDEYYFLEIDKNRIAELIESIKQRYPQKVSKVHFINGDSNAELIRLLDNITVKDRCLMFLDPYALELNWSTLQRIANKAVIDLWYLFPLSALTRIIPKDASKLTVNEALVSRILGTEEWKTTLYEESQQCDFFGQKSISRVQYDKLIQYVIERFKTIFPTVTSNHIILRNERRSPLFLLCFMMTNPSEKATSLAEKLVQGIKSKLEKTYGKNN